MPVAVALPFIAIIVALFAWQVAKSWDYTFGPLIQGIADKIDAIRSPTVFGRSINFHGAAQSLRAIDANLRHLIGVAIEHVSTPLLHAFNAVGNAFYYPVRELLRLAQDVRRTLWQLRHVIIPAMLAAKVASIWRRIGALEHRAAQVIVHPPVTIVRTSVRVLRPIETTIVRKAVAIPLPRIGRLERETEGIGSRLKRLAGRVTPAALVAPVVFALSSVGLGWLRCSRVKNAGKQVCGMDSTLLDALIADTLLVVGTVSLVEFAEGLGKGIGEVTPQIQKFWRA